MVLATCAAPWRTNRRRTTRIEKCRRRRCSSWCLASNPRSGSTLRIRYMCIELHPPPIPRKVGGIDGHSGSILEHPLDANFVEFRLQICKSAAYCTDSQRMCTWSGAETDESIVLARTRSPGGSRPYPRFSPGAGGATCTYLHFPPSAIEAFVQSSARRCMCVHGTLSSYPREVHEVFLRSLLDFKELVR